MHHIGVRLFDLIKQHNRIRPAPHSLGKLSALFVTDVPWRRTDQTRCGEFFHVLRHVDLNQRVGVTEHEFGESAREIRFADSSGTEKDERTDRAPWILQVGARATQSFADGCDRFLLTNDALLHFRFHHEEFLRFLLLHPLQWDAGDLRDDVHHVVRGYHDLFFFPFLTPFIENGIEFFFCLLLLVAKRCSFLKILRLDCAFLFHPDLFYFFLDVLHIGRTGHGIDPGTRAGLIHDIDSLVGEKPSRDITIRKSDRSLQRLVSEFCLVVRLVLGSKAFQDLNRFINRRRIHLYRLETTFERCVFLDVLPVLVHRGRADTLQFATTQRGFDNVRRVHSPFGGTCPDNRVQLVDEKNHVLGTADFVHHSYDTLFELTAVFCSSHH